MNKNVKFLLCFIIITIVIFIAEKSMGIKLDDNIFIEFGRRFIWMTFGIISAKM